MNLRLDSDVVVACLLPLTLGFVLYRIQPEFSWSNVYSALSLTDKKDTNAFSKQNAYHSFANYRELAGSELRVMKTAYGNVGRGSKRIGQAIGYSAKLDRRAEVTRANAIVTDGIANLACQQLSPEQKSPWGRPRTDLMRVREAMKHFVRDWSEAGAPEREKIFKPVLDALQHTRDPSRKQRVLVPGSGLGRLAWDISRLGFDTTANELSYFMIHAFNFLLSPTTTNQTNQHTIHPFAHWFSHQRNNDALFRGIQFPDVLPRLDEDLHLVDKDFFLLKKDEPFDYIVTLFFIDTSPNIIATLERIHALLAPGGIWINLGPLLWSATAKVQLSLDEVFQAAEAVGFTVLNDAEDTGDEWKRRKTVECEYTSDHEAMMRWIYEAEYWVARRN